MTDGEESIERSTTSTISDSTHSDVEWEDRRAEHFLSIEERVQPDPADTPSPTEESSPTTSTVRHPAHTATVEWLEEVPVEDIPYDIQVECLKSHDVTIEDVFDGHEGDSVRHVAANKLAEVTSETYLCLELGVGEETTFTEYLPIPDEDSYEESVLSDIISHTGGSDWEIGALNSAQLPIHREDSGDYSLNLNASDSYRWKLENGYLQWSDENGYNMEPRIKGGIVLTSGIAHLPFTVLLLTSSITPLMMMGHLWEAEMDGGNFILMLASMLPMLFSLVIEDRMDAMAHRTQVGLFERFVAPVVVGR